MFLVVLLVWVNTEDVVWIKDPVSYVYQYSWSSTYYDAIAQFLQKK